MRAFSQLLDDLVYTRSRNTKLKLIGDYLKEVPDPDRGYGLAALTGTLDIPHVKPAAIRGLVEERIDPVLFYMSRDYVGDTAETVSLLWPKRDAEPPEIDDATIRISDAIERLRSASKMDAPHVLGAMLDHLDASGRYALLKLALGELRVESTRGWRSRRSPTRSASTSMRWRRCGTDCARRSPSCSTGPRDAASSRSLRDVAVFRPFMLAHPLDETRVSLEDYAAEWKWDGIRVQLVHAGGETRIFSRTGDDISGSFPDVAEAFRTKPCSTANSWSAGPTRASPTCMAARPRASTRSSSGSGARTSARRCSAHIRRSCASTTCCSRATRTCASSLGASGGRGSRVRRRTRSRALRCFAADRRERASRSSKTFGSTPATCRSKASCSSAATAPMSPAAAPACGTNGSAIR